MRAAANEEERHPAAHEEESEEAKGEGLPEERTRRDADLRENLVTQLPLVTRDLME